METSGRALLRLPAVSQPGVIPTDSFHRESRDCAASGCPELWIMPSTASPTRQGPATPQPGPTAPSQPSSPQKAGWDRTHDVGFAGGGFPRKPPSRSSPLGLPEVPEQAGQGGAVSQGGDNGFIPTQEWLPAGKAWPRRIRPRRTRWGAGMQSCTPRSGTPPYQCPCTSASQFSTGEVTPGRDRAAWLLQRPAMFPGGFAL